MPQPVDNPRSARSIGDGAPIRLLLVEDDQDHAALVRRSFARDEESWEVETCARLVEAEARLAEGNVDIVLTDLRLPDGRGEALIPYDVPVVVMTSGGSEETAVAALRLGAVDYVVKSVDSMRAMAGRVARRFTTWQRERVAEAEQARLVEVLGAAERVALLGNWQVDLRTGEVWGTRGQRALLGMGPTDPWPSWRVVSEWLGRPAAASLLQQAQVGLHADRRFDIEVTFAGGPVAGAIHRITGSFELDAQKQPIRVWGVSQDLTERRQMEVELQQIKRLEGIGRLAGGIAHDFNNLLTVMLGHASFLGEDFADDVNARECVAAIQGAGERARDLTHQLLTFARKQMADPQLVDVGECVTRTWKMLGRVLGAQLEVRVEVPGDLPRVYIDPSQLEQVILNLAVNARDAVPKGGRLTVRGFRREENDSPWVLLEFEDNGEGISPDDLPHIFEPFFTTKAEGTGTGLGLATVHGIVHRAGGRIEVDSDPSGTLFRVFLPGFRGSLPKPLKLSRPTLAGRGERVLVVDDDDGVRQVTVRILQSLGYSVVALAGGNEALDWLADNPCDLVLADVVMPELTGAELAATLAGRYPDLPMVFMSGFIDTPLLTEQMRRAPIVAKPFRPDDLVDAIQRALRSETPGR